MDQVDSQKLKSRVLRILEISERAGPTNGKLGPVNGRRYSHKVPKALRHVNHGLWFELISILVYRLSIGSDLVSCVSSSMCEHKYGAYPERRSATAIRPGTAL